MTVSFCQMYCSRFHLRNYQVGPTDKMLLNCP